jgi:RNA polymerase sigma-70 factor (ECF subfamily)
MADSLAGGAGSSRKLDTTQDLLDRIRGGDHRAREVLYARLIPSMRRWARGKLPARARDLTQTDDIVQIAVSRSLSRLEEFESKGPGSFLGYLHRILLNCIRDEYRRAQRVPDAEPLPDELAENAPSLVERTLGSEVLAAYEGAIERLSGAQRDALILRIEFGFTFPEIAEALGKPTPNAARMLVMRALVRVVERMHGQE